MTSSAVSTDLGSLCGVPDGIRGVRRDHCGDRRGRVHSACRRVGDEVPGFTILYTEARDTAEDEESAALPLLQEEQALKLIELLPRQHFTQPPPRYTEATLVKEMEEKGIGRPSTYASIIGTIQERGYVLLRRRSFVRQAWPPGHRVPGEHFPDIMECATRHGVGARRGGGRQGGLGRGGA